MQDYKYAIIAQNGQLIDYSNDATLKEWMIKDRLHVVSTELPHLELCYQEYAGPHGYGCNIPEFETYGSLVEIIRNLYKYCKNSASVFGPDPREIKNYLKRCALYIDGESYSIKFHEHIDKMFSKGTLWV